MHYNSIEFAEKMINKYLSELTIEHRITELTIALNQLEISDYFKSLKSKIKKSKSRFSLNEKTLIKI